MQLKEEEHNECVNVIDTLHNMAHKGAFKNIDISIVKRFMDFVSVMMDVKLTPKQAQEVFDVKPSIYRNTIARKVPESEKNRVKENTSFIRYGLLKELFGKKKSPTE